MYHIVAGIDSNEERGRSQARTIAEMPMERSSVHVTLLHAFSKKPNPGVSSRNIVSVRRAAEVLDEAGIDASFAESPADPARSILDAADERDADLIVLAGRKRTPTGKALFGSVTQRVVLETDRPVLVCSGTDA